MNIIRFILFFSVPYASTALMIFGSSFFMTFLSVFLEKEGYSRSTIGILHSAFFLGLLLGALNMKRLIQKVGPNQTLMFFGSVSTCSILLQALYPSIIIWVILRFIVGVSLSALYIIVESWILDNSTANYRGVLLSLYMLCITVSRSTSQFILSYVDIYGFTPFIVSALFTSLSTIPLGLSTPQLIHSPPTEESPKYTNIVKYSPLAASGCFISGLMLSSIYSFFPVFSISKGIPSQNLMAITLAGGIFFPWPSGLLSDFYDRRKCLILFIGVAFAFCNIGFFYEEIQDWQFLFLCFYIGGFALALYPLGVALMCDHIQESNFTNVVSFLLISFGIGSVLGPLISSVTVEMFGIDAILIYFALILAIPGGIGAYSILKRPAVAQEDKSEFLNVRHVTPVAVEIDPRGE